MPLLLVVAVLAVASCDKLSVDEACAVDGDCFGGERCVDSVCAPVAVTHDTGQDTADRAECDPVPEQCLTETAWCEERIREESLSGEDTVAFAAVQCVTDDNGCVELVRSECFDEGMPCEGGACRPCEPDPGCPDTGIDGATRCATTGTEIRTCWLDAVDCIEPHVLRACLPSEVCHRTEGARGCVAMCAGATRLECGESLTVDTAQGNTQHGDHTCNGSNGSYAGMDVTAVLYTQLDTRVTVSLTFDEAEANLDLFVFDGPSACSGSPECLGSSATTAGTEEVMFRTIWEHAYTIVVDTFDDATATTTYTLTVSCE